MSSAVASICTGFWINWSYGRVRGSTITLTAQNSAFLIAFIALWVRFVGGQLWTVITFLASITRSTIEPQDALYHQQQAILRNTSQPFSVAWVMLKLSWFWKGTARRARTRTFGFIFGALAYIAAFAIAGIFSSRLSSNDSEVLLSPSSSCGIWPYPEPLTGSEAVTGYQNWAIQESEYASNFVQLAQRGHVYVSQCYNSTLNNPNEPCLPYGKNQITWTTNPNAACPIDKDMCIADAIEFDTGFLSSDTHLGINTKDEHIEYRRVMTCAPMTTDGYAAGYFNSADLNITDSAIGSFNPNDTFMTYSYGQGIFFTDNTTFAMTNWGFDYSIGYWVPYRLYDLDVEFVDAFTTGDADAGTLSSFQPIPSLNRSDADLSLVFLATDAVFLSEVNDPWFNFTIPQTSQLTGVDGVIHNVTLYSPAQGCTVVACMEQHQLRNPRTGATTPLGGQEYLAVSQAERLGFNEDQMAIFNRSFFYSKFSRISSVASSLGGSNLLAVAYEDNIKSTAFPDNQWQLEFEHYFGVGLIAMQLWSQQYVSGTTRPEMNAYIVPAPEGFAKEMCKQQIVRRTDHRSFSVLGLVIIFSFGFLFIIANLTVGSIVEKIQKQSLNGRYRNAEWSANNFLQLQHMTYQHSNIGTWVGQYDMVPRTNPGELFTIPESTQWNHGVPDSLNKEEKGLFRTWTRRSRGVCQELKILNRRPKKAQT